MRDISKSSKFLTLAAMLAVSTSLAAQPQDQEPPQDQAPPQEQVQPPAADLTGSVTDTSAPDASELTPGPDVAGIITARKGDKVKVTSPDGTATIVAVNDATRISGKGGFLGLGSNKLATDSLLNGLPVKVKTLRSGDYVLASRINLQNRDLKVASMIRSGTEQGFAEQTAATEALRSRVADIGQYNVKATTNVNFDTGKAVLTEQAKSDLCAAASAAEGVSNAMLLVVGYTDSTGSEELNQQLSEKRAGRVVNYLQQACGWKPYRMLTPTGMSEADPLADNDSYEGKAQNRRVAVNILVSKGLDGM
jgi:outer membrane protein OmpA-like peptidoglycan-associated protein